MTFSTLCISREEDWGLLEVDYESCVVTGSDFVLFVGGQHIANRLLLAEGGVIQRLVRQTGVLLAGWGRAARCAWGAGRGW